MPNPDWITLEKKIEIGNAPITFFWKAITHYFLKNDFIKFFNVQQIRNSAKNKRFPKNDKKNWARTISIFLRRSVLHERIYMGKTQKEIYEIVLWHYR